MVDLFGKIEEGLEFAEAENNPIPGGGGGQYCLSTDAQNCRNGKILWEVGIHAGWSNELAVLQGQFFEILQALPYPQ